MPFPRPPLHLPAPLLRRLEAVAAGFLHPPGEQWPDFTTPLGAPALAGPGSISWRIFRNPVALAVGGIAAVILELAEPRVRAGVWEHTGFRTDPLRRLRRTGMAAMVTVYAPRHAAEAMIAAINRAHARVGGRTAEGVPYRADETELLDWVQATASFGFLEAYHRLVRPLSPRERDAFLAEAVPAARLYGALHAPASEAALAEVLGLWRPRLQPCATIHEFLAIMRRAPLLPAPLRPLQGMLVRAAVALLPPWAPPLLELEQRPRPGEEWLLGAMARLADRVVLEGSPAAQACRRLGLPADHLHRTVPDV